MNKEIEKFVEISSKVNSCYTDVYDNGIRYDELNFVISIEALNIKTKFKDEIELFFPLEDFYFFNMADEGLFSDYVLANYFEEPHFNWLALSESPVLEDLNSKCFDLSKSMFLIDFLIFTSGICFQVISQSAPQLIITKQNMSNRKTDNNESGTSIQNH